MAICTTYYARANLVKLCNDVTLNQEVVIINRRGAQDVALISAAEFASLADNSAGFKKSGTREVRQTRA
jgi:antitoxin YefM